MALTWKSGGGGRSNVKYKNFELETVSTKMNNNTSCTITERRRYLCTPPSPRDPECLSAEGTEVEDEGSRGKD